MNEYNNVVQLFLLLIIGLIAGIILGGIFGYNLHSCEEQEMQIEKISGNLAVCENTIIGFQLGYQACIEMNEQSDEQIQNLTEQLDDCENPVVFECNIDKYSNGCEDVPDSTLFNKMSHYSCYWEFREAYPQYGSYVDVGTICATQRLGWALACSCTEKMAGDIFSKEEINKMIGNTMQTGGIIIK